MYIYIIIYIYVGYIWKSFYPNVVPLIIYDVSVTNSRATLLVRLSRAFQILKVVAMRTALDAPDSELFNVGSRQAKCMKRALPSAIDSVTATKASCLTHS